MKRHLFIYIAGFWVCSLPLFSQEKFDPEKTFYDAEFHLMYERYGEALPLYISLPESGLSNANILYKIGLCWLNTPGSKTKSIPFLEEAVKNSHWRSRADLFKEKKAPGDAKLLLARAYHLNNDFGKAVEYYSVFISEAEAALVKYKSNPVLSGKINQGIDQAARGRANCELAQNMMKSQVDYEINPIDKVNIGPANFRPAISGDERSLVFMSNRRYYDAVYFSTLKSGNWSTPRNITMELESDGTYQPASLSYNGKKLFLVHRENNNLDLYESDYADYRWSRISPLNNNINSGMDEVHAFQSPDGKTLFFASNRKGGTGGLDIFMSPLSPTGEWREAVNLGPPVNTPLNEHSPFLSQDGQILYFSSNGHPGMGGYDVFSSNRNPDGSWSTPVNLGHPVNTTDDDLFYSPASSGFSGLLSRFVTGSDNEQKIYEMEFFSGSNPRKITIAGVVDLKEALLSTENEVLVRLVAPDNDTITSLLTNGQGEYVIKAKPGRYQIHFEKEGFIKRTETLAIEPGTKEEMVELNVTLSPEITEELSVADTIGYILFGYDDYSLSKTSTRELDNIRRILDRHTGIGLVITGHTDSKGSAGYNAELSRKRSLSVLNYLSEKGIDQVRLEPAWKGESEPVALNENTDGTDNPRGRSFNRRVVFRFRGPAPENVRIREINLPADVTLQ